MTVKRTMFIALVGLLAAALFVPIAASARTPNTGYNYNSYDFGVVSKNGYTYLDSIDGAFLPTGAFKDPGDIFITHDDIIYLADTGNARIIKMDKNRNVLLVVGDKEGKGKLTKPKGLFVTSDGDIYVTDPAEKARRIVVFDKNGNYKKEFGKPESPLLGSGFTFSPSKLIVDRRGYMFVSIDGGADGLLQLDPNGAFKGYFGANKVGFSWRRLMIKLIATKEQQAQMPLFKPSEFSNVFQDSEGYIYTTSLGLLTEQVKRLSAVGVDTLKTSKTTTWGERFNSDETTYQAMADVTVDKDGFITALDSMEGKFYQYDKLGNQLFISGGTGEQNGLFKTAISIGQTSDGLIYVVDQTRGRIDRFQTTHFGELVRQASILYSEGKYEEAAAPWHKVLEFSSNYDLAYIAIGKALVKEEKYEEAMTYFKTGIARTDYSAAFKEYRKVYMRQNFGLIVGIILGGYIVLRVAIWLIRRWLKTRFLPVNATVKPAIGKGAVEQ